MIRRRVQPSAERISKVGRRGASSAAEGAFPVELVRPAEEAEVGHGGSAGIAAAVHAGVDDSRAKSPCGAAGSLVTRVWLPSGLRKRLLWWRPWMAKRSWLPGVAKKRRPWRAR